MNMKSVYFSAVAVILCAPLLAKAQAPANQPLTRTEVHAQMVQLENAGYDRFDDRLDYPQDVQTAEKKLAANNLMPVSDTEQPAASVNAKSAQRQAHDNVVNHRKSVGFGIESWNPPGPNAWPINSGAS